MSASIDPPDPRGAPELRFWFNIQSMIHKHNVTQRYEDGTWRPDRYGIREWLPPRPYRYNIRHPDDPYGTWYLFDQARVTRRPAPPEPGLVSHYKTFSFYVNNSRIWIYPCNALKFQVGDGSQYPPSMTGQVEADSSSDEYDNDDDGLEAASASHADWSELEFNCITRDQNTVASFATTRGESETLHVRRPNHIWPSEVLPHRYWLPQNQQLDDNMHNGMMAEIPIKIALIALSVPPPEVHDALVNSFRNTYVSSSQIRGLGWTNRRGLVVRVYCELGADRTLQRFERNDLNYGDFFP